MNTTTPEQAGVSSTRLDRIGPVMRRYVDESKLAGILTLVARRGRIVHLEKIGMMDIAANKPMQFDTIFRIYSMTKPITSVAVMMLYEKGRFQLNDPVSRFIPGFKDVKVFAGQTTSGLELVDAEREITIWDLLTHTSGLSYGGGSRFTSRCTVSQTDLGEAGTKARNDIRGHGKEAHQAAACASTRRWLDL